MNEIENKSLRVISFTCRSCFEVKELTPQNFYRLSSSSLGYSPHCKSCYSIKGKLSRMKNKSVSKGGESVDYTWCGPDALYC